LKSVKEIYFSGYSAFEKGRFQEAAKIAQECLRASEEKSYWHFGTLGLCCWISNFIGDHVGVEKYAHSLLESDSGEQKAWFDALACFNLGIAYKRNSRLDDAKVFFNDASRLYSSFLEQKDRPSEWSFIVKLFFSISKYAASGEKEHFSDLLGELQRSADKSEAVKHIEDVVRIYIRHTKGADVKLDAAKAVHKGVSRTFLAFVLLEH
jgi:tetratricopeptide (TPR) repeat protein